MSMVTGTADSDPWITGEGSDIFMEILFPSCPTCDLA